ncbi:MAG: HPr family phosphocarrier protein [Myxococcales bacterium]|nr:HPr family phosphocarrier protein [Myxococcales bacterium]
MSQEHKVSVEIQNRLGLHTRAATLLVQLASSFPCEVFLEKDGQEVNGKSIMGILMLVASQGSVITVRCEGERAEAACAALVKLIDSKFGENE